MGELVGGVRMFEIMANISIYPLLPRPAGAEARRADVGVVSTHQAGFYGLTENDAAPTRGLREYLECLASIACERGPLSQWHDEAMIAVPAHLSKKGTRRRLSLVSEAPPCAQASHGVLGGAPLMKSAALPCGAVGRAV
jgi:hypothetical protein